VSSTIETRDRNGVRQYGREHDDRSAVGWAQGLPA
jgi:hypothetical protein